HPSGWPHFVFLGVPPKGPQHPSRRGPREPPHRSPGPSRAGLQLAGTHPAKKRRPLLRRERQVPLVPVLRVPDVNSRGILPHLDALTPGVAVTALVPLAHFARSPRRVRDWSAGNASPKARFDSSSRRAQST